MSRYFCANATTKCIHRRVFEIKTNKRNLEIYLWHLIALIDKQFNFATMFISSLLMNINVNINSLYAIGAEHKRF